MQDLPAFVQIHTYFDNSVGQSTTVHWYISTNHIKYGDYDIIYEQFPSFPCRLQLQDCSIVPGCSWSPGRDVMDSGAILSLNQVLLYHHWVRNMNSSPFNFLKFHTSDVEQRRRSVISWGIYPPGSWLHRNVGLQTSTQSVVQIKRKIWISLETRQLGCKIYMTSDIMSAVVEIM